MLLQSLNINGTRKLTIPKQRKKVNKQNNNFSIWEQKNGNQDNEDLLFCIQGGNRQGSLSTDIPGSG